ncbi:hypothetical protein D3C86_1887900 [compost metagenome]
MPSYCDSGYMSMPDNAGCTAWRSAAVSSWNTRGITNPVFVRERYTRLMPGGTLPFQSGPTNR